MTNSLIEALYPNIEPVRNGTIPRLRTCRTLSQVVGKLKVGSFFVTDWYYQDSQYPNTSLQYGVKLYDSGWNMIMYDLNHGSFENLRYASGRKFTGDIIKNTNKVYDMDTNHNMLTVNGVTHKLRPVVVRDISRVGDRVTGITCFYCTSRSGKSNKQIAVDLGNGMKTNVILNRFVTIEPNDFHNMIVVGDVLSLSDDDKERLEKADSNNRVPLSRLNTWVVSQGCSRLGGLEEQDHNPNNLRGENVQLNEGVNYEVDSNGNKLTKEQIDFFKDSKVRDNKGRLIVCYHNTNNDFTKFDKGRFGKGNGYTFGYGFYFSNYNGFVSAYGNKQIKCYINLKNPFDYDNWGVEDLDSIVNRSGVKFNKEILDKYKREASADNFMYDDLLEVLNKIFIDTNSSTVFSGILQKLGYDGTMIGGGDEVIAFEPNQIKAISNQTPTDSEDINEEKDMNNKLVLDEGALDETISSAIPNEVKKWIEEDIKVCKELYPQYDYSIIDFSLSTRVNALGDIQYAERPVIRLSSHTLNDGENYIHNIILHELVHFVCLQKALKEGYVYFRGKNLYVNVSKADKKYVSNEILGHGKWFREIGDALGFRTGQNLERTGRSAGIDAKRKDKIVWVVKCTNCGNTFIHKRATDFTKNPNEKSAWHGDYRWVCGNCHKGGYFEVSKEKYSDYLDAEKGDNK